MLTSPPIHTDTYPTSADLTPLRINLLANYGTMLTVRAGSLTFCSRMAMLVAGLEISSASAKIFLDICFVCMHRSPTIPAWDVHAIYHADEGSDPSSTHLLTYWSISTVCLWRSTLLVHGWQHHATLSLSVWCRGIANCTLRLTPLALVDLDLPLARAVPGYLEVSTSRINSLSMVSRASTWLVSGV